MPIMPYNPYSRPAAPPPAVPYDDGYVSPSARPYPAPGIADLAAGRWADDAVQVWQRAYEARCAVEPLIMRSGDLSVTLRITDSGEIEAHGCDQATLISAYRAAPADWRALVLRARELTQIAAATERSAGNAESYADYCNWKRAAAQRRAS